MLSVETNAELGSRNAEDSECGSRNAERGIQKTEDGVFRSRNAEDSECGSRNAERGIQKTEFLIRHSAFGIRHSLYMHPSPIVLNIITPDSEKVNEKAAIADLNVSSAALL